MRVLITFRQPFFLNEYLLPMKFSKINFSKIIFEFISVSFAVLFAILLNQWREDRNNKDLAQKVLVNVGEEFIENKETLYSFVPEHKALLIEIDSMITLSNNDDKVVNKEINLNLLSSSAWEMAKITNAVFYLDFDVVNNLAKIYKLQNYYESIIKQYNLKEAIAGQNKNEVEQLLESKRLLETIIPLEESLIGYYDLMLDKVLTKK